MINSASHCRNMSEFRLSKFLTKLDTFQFVEATEWKKTENRTSTDDIMQRADLQRYTFLCHAEPYAVV